MYSPNASNNNQTTSTYSYSQMTTQGQFSDPVLASFFQNNQDNGQMFYSTTNETTTQEYAGAPIQSQDNMIYNSNSDNNIINSYKKKYGDNQNSMYYNYINEKKQIYTTICFL